MFFARKKHKSNLVVYCSPTTIILDFNQLNSYISVASVHILVIQTSLYKYLIYNNR
jgi:hypothetical protein